MIDERRRWWEGLGSVSWVDWECESFERLSCDWVYLECCGGIGELSRSAVRKDMRVGWRTVFCST